MCQLAFAALMGMLCRLRVELNPIEWTVKLVNETPYRASWINYVLAWIDGLPIPAFVFYLLVYGTFLGLVHLAAWLEGFLPFGRFHSEFAFDMVWVPFGLGYIHLMERSADRSIREFRPALAVADDEFAMIAYRFTTLPALPVLGLTLLGLMIGWTEALGIVSILRPDNGISLSFVMLGVLSASGYAFLPVWIFAAIRHLVHINQLFGRVTGLNLFNLQPLYGLANVTMIVAIFFILIANMNYASEMFLGTRTMSSPENVVLFSGAILGLGLIVIIVPLLGIHRRIEQEKRQLLAEAAQDIEDLRRQLSAEVRGGGYQQIQHIEKALNAVFQLRTNIQAVPAWPWRPGTLRNFGTAILLPLVIWLAQRLLAPLF